ncbi:MAG: AAA family ATPase, partial [Candidatus Omnitrophica bacterium]|nr:AAA family ATPase [Candidatus Omnitrophota bacterium]
MHLLLTGKPACGKTTLIKDILPRFSNIRGFFTEEIKENNQRMGFKIITLTGKESIFAHKNFVSSYNVGNYKIDIDVFNFIAVTELKEALESKSKVIIIDEIGRMELFSEEFRKICLEIFDKKKVLGTISLTDHPFINLIKNRKDVYILELNRENFSQIKEEV